MERKSFFRRFFGGSLTLFLVAAGLIVGAVVLLYPRDRQPRSEETVRPAMAALPTPTPTLPQKLPKLQPEAAQPKAVLPEVEEPAVEETMALPLYFIWPVTGNLARGYDRDTLSYDTTMGDWRTHNGWDIAAGLGGHVLSAANGTVSAVYTDPLYGTTVEIDHGDGLCSVYANLAAEPTVSVGQSVQVGDIIGAVGESALCEVSEGYHLHFAMKLNGETADPAGWLPER